MSALSATDQDDEVAGRLKAFEGRPSGPPMKAPDPVNQAMIRHWVEAIGDENPVYVDTRAAVANGFPGIVAPPTMLQAWVMRGYRATAALESARAKDRGSGGPAAVQPRADPPVVGPASAAQDELFALLDAAGFTSVVATNCEQHYNRPLVLGDKLTASSVIESVSDRKTTGLGEGYFVTSRTDFVDDDGDQVATMRFRVLRFRPRRRDEKPSVAEAPSAERPRRPRPAVTQDNAFFFEGAKQSKLLVQRCAECARLRHPPRPACPHCGAFDWDTVESSGRGEVYSFVVVHHPQVPGFEYPLPIAVVALDEGTRLVADLVEVEPGDVSIGMPVECVFVAVDDGLTLPMFRPANSGGG
ncbi:MAG: bifunctional MaoC family dehydratase N-terminal/OB-fold nucleic acid binding domain-containing protein [Acidimicrobiales bacterium]